MSVPKLLKLVAYCVFTPLCLAVDYYFGASWLITWVLGGLAVIAIAMLILALYILYAVRRDNDYFCLKDIARHHANNEQWFRWYVRLPTYALTFVCWWIMINTGHLVVAVLGMISFALSLLVFEEARQITIWWRTMQAPRPAE